MPLFFIPQSCVFTVSGSHAERYLQSRLSNDIKTLKESQSCAAAALSAQGKCDALFYVLRTSQDTFLLNCDGGSFEEISSSLLRFRVTEQVEVEHHPDWEVYHVVDQDWSPPESTSHQTDIYIDKRNRFGKIGYEILGQKAALAELLTTLPKASDESSFHKARVLANMPTFPFDIKPQQLFVESGRQDAISHNKGCYVGQEVVEKIAAIGRVPKKFYPLVLEGEVSLVGNDTVGLQREDSENYSLGKIASWSYDASEDRTYCFAVLKNEPIAPDATVLVNGHSGRFSGNTG